MAIAGPHQATQGDWVFLATQREVPTISSLHSIGIVCRGGFWDRILPSHCPPLVLPSPCQSLAVSLGNRAVSHFVDKETEAPRSNSQYWAQAESSP
jgi:hypothetical protein